MLRPLTNPRRRRTLRRIIVCTLSPILAFLALRLIWGYEANHRLADLIADLRKANIPMEVPGSEMRTQIDPTLPLAKALSALSLNHAEEDLIDGSKRANTEDGLHFSDAQKPDVDRIIQKNVPAFRLIDAADQSSIPKGQHLPVGHLTVARALGNVLRAAAVTAHDNHDDAAALLDIWRIVVISQCVDTSRDEISHLIAAALRARADEAIEQIESTMRISELDETKTRAQKLLEALIGMDAFCKNASAAYDEEFRSSDSNYFKTVGIPGWWIRPLYLDEESRTLQMMLEQRKLTLADSWSEMVAPRASYSYFASPPNLERTIVFISGGFTPTYRYMTMHFRAIAFSEAAASLLASRLYQSAHAKLPESFNQLVPDFLPATPTDPYSGNHAPMHLRLDPDGPTIWSVGENGTDEGGIVRFDSSGNKGSRWENTRSDATPDIVFGAAWIHAKPSAAPATRPAPMLMTFTPSAPATSPSTTSFAPKSH
jgi:hypothetical protein